MKRPCLVVLLAIILGSVWLLPLVERPVRETWLPKLASIGFVLVVSILGFNFKRVWVGDSLGGDDTDVDGITESGVGVLALVGGLLFLSLGGSLYVIGSLDGRAALPVVVVGG